ncbi:MAG: recombination mediator RecR [Firmicutes bacterium]|nr:recombination mediator RecR [Bacillota bacterium]
MYISEPVARLINELMKLPSIGPRSAQRLAYHIVNIPIEDAAKLARAILDVKEKIHQCRICHNLTDEEVCSICTDEARTTGMVCIVASAKDIPPIEKAKVFRGKYHVLGGVISPLDGIGPDRLNIKSLLARIGTEGINEAIVATDSDTSGEVTALYLAKILSPLDIKVSRLAYGLPMGAALEYADEITISRAIEGRREIGSTPAS